MLLDKQNNQESYIYTIEQEIVKLDRQIINLISERCRYLQIVSKTKRQKNKHQSIREFKSILEQRKTWAIEAGLCPNFVNKISQYLIDYYLTEEI